LSNFPVNSTALIEALVTLPRTAGAATASASAFVLLFLAFGSVVLPLKAIVMNVPRPLRRLYARYGSRRKPRVLRRCLLASGADRAVPQAAGEACGLRVQ
jgi:hypothetical protein